jgi:hypothetical protein
MRTATIFLPFGMAGVTILHELQVPGLRRDIALAELMADDEAEFSYMPDHRHIALLAFVGPFGIALLRDDLRRVDVERERSPFVLPQKTLEHGVVDAVHALKPLALSHAAQPVSRRVAARYDVELQQPAQGRVSS